MVFCTSRAVGPRPRTFRHQSALQCRARQTAYQAQLPFDRGILAVARDFEGLRNGEL